jgi:hypothetical protein
MRLPKWPISTVKSATDNCSGQTQGVGAIRLQVGAIGLVSLRARS